MPSKLYPTGTRMIDTSEILASDTVVLTALNATVGTLPANIITGGMMVVCLSTNSTPGTQTTRAAATMYAEDPTAAIGNGYILRVCNGGGSGTLTLAGGAGVTVTGTATIANATFRDFSVVWSGTVLAPLMTITNIGTGTYS
jgi:hypothetical protein